MGAQFHVATDIHEGVITQTLRSNYDGYISTQDMLPRWVMDTRDIQVRRALMELGWAPPPEEPGARKMVGATMRIHKMEVQHIGAAVVEKHAKERLAHELAHALLGHELIRFTKRDADEFVEELEGRVIAQRPDDLSKAGRLPLSKLERKP
jgi:hypothetical protein